MRGPPRARRARPSRARRRAGRAGGSGSRPPASSGRRAPPRRRARARTRRAAARRRAPPRSATGSRARRSRRGRAAASRGRRPRGRSPAASRGRLARGAPAALAGDQLVAALRPRPHDDGLDQTLGADRVGEPGGRLVLEAAARLARVRMDLARAAGARARARRRAADQHLEAAAEAAARASAARQAPSPPSSTPRLLPNGGRSASTGSPWLGASARRTDRGTTVVEDELAEVAPHLGGDVRREAGAAVDHRQQHAGDPELRVQPGLDEVDRLDDLREPLERVVLGLHRDHDPIRRGKGVDGQRPERRRAVEQHEVEALDVRERLREVAVAVLVLRELDRGARELRLRRDEEEVVPARLLGELAERRAVQQVVARRPVRAHRRGRRSRSPAGRGRSTSARWPASARQAARLIAVVVLPTPPFWFAKA